MELAEAQQILTTIHDSTPSSLWSVALTTAVQRALAELYLLNPHDDVDGAIGSRTRAGWRLFKEVGDLANPDTLEAKSAGLLIEASRNPALQIGTPRVDLQPDFAFRRGSKHRTENAEASAAALISAATTEGLTKPQVAYVLATAEHESDSFQTLEEYANGSGYEGRGDLGNTRGGDGVRFKGRGYVQLTGRLNYQRYRDKTGVELVKYPLVLMNWAALSVFVIIDGMKNGVYTGRRLDEFVSDRTQDFFNARQVVNGHDRAEKIADQASDWLQKL